MDNGTVTPGWKTSEFWLHILAQAPAVLGIFIGAANPVVIGVAAFANLGAAVYTAMRSNVKIASIGATAAPAAVDAANAAAAALTKLSAGAAGSAAEAAAQAAAASKGA